MVSTILTQYMKNHSTDFQNTYSDAIKVNIGPLFKRVKKVKTLIEKFIQY
jgi:hypothetical protein